MEKLATELGAYLLAPIEETARAECRLFAACVEVGMSHDEASASEWAAVKVIKWLRSAPHLEG